MITAQGLTKVYGHRTVVDDVSFELRPGTVTAFLGSNGAGKSTTLRMLTGLTVPSRGSALVAGRPFIEWPNPGHIVGVVLDASAIHPGRTGLAHLRHACRMTGSPPSRAEHVLAHVGLESAAKARVRSYSLGMRQRLGLAHALLADPPVLVLDEPINGLDPPGIRWIRDLLRRHAERGGTVLVSSHVLSEVEQTADRALVISGGRIVADGPVDQLHGPPRTLVRGPDMQSLATALSGAGVRVIGVRNAGLLVEAVPEAVGDIVFDAGLRVTGIAADSSGLEDVYLRLAASGEPR